MNTKGIEYTNDVNTRFSELYKKAKENNEPLPRTTFSQSEITERIMRLGIEAKVYELTPDEYEDMARTTLKEDQLVRHYATRY